MLRSVTERLLRLPRLFENTWAPERFHGHDRRPPFFEGWYYKLVDAAGEQRWAVIPGIFLSDDPARHHAFVQVLDGSSGEASIHRYPAEAFHAARDAFRVRVGPNEFGPDGFRLDIDDDQRRLQGEIALVDRTPWSVTPLSPGVMGPFGLIPIMECYHGVLSMDHGLRGRLTIDGVERDFTGGRGYHEKDWGKSFPAGYVWMQSNHFDEPGTSFFGSIAIIPWLRRPFAGFLMGFLHRGRLRRFSTYTGTVTERLEITDDYVRWVSRRGPERLRVRAERTRGGLLLGPTREDMSSRVGETMRSAIRVTLTEHHRGGERTLFEGEGRHAGLEVQGDLEQLLALQR